MYKTGKCEYCGNHIIIKYNPYPLFRGLTEFIRKVLHSRNFTRWLFGG